MSDALKTREALEDLILNHAMATKRKATLMSPADFDLIRSDKAIVAHRQINSEVGGATVRCVVLADGFIVECGSDGYAESRARLLADAVNAADPSSFAFGRLALEDKP